jgi:hypothetical protein
MDTPDSQGASGAAISGRMQSRRGLTCCGVPRRVPFACRRTWTGRGNAVYDLDTPGRVVDLYRAVLIEAATPQDLYAYLDERVLRRLWALLWLPAQLRRGWEQRFPVPAEISRITASA